MTPKHTEKIDTVLIKEGDQLIEMEHVALHAKKLGINASALNTKRSRNKLNENNKYIKGGFYFKAVKQEEKNDKSCISPVESRRRRED